MLRKKLSGTARRFVFTQRDVGTFAKLKRALIAEFAPLVRACDVHRQLAARKADGIPKEKRSEVKCWRKEKRRGKNGMAYWERFRKSFNALRVFIDFVLRQQHAACDQRESAHGCFIRFLLLSHVPFASTEACKGDSVECSKFVKIISHQAGRLLLDGVRRKPFKSLSMFIFRHHPHSSPLEITM